MPAHSSLLVPEFLARNSITTLDHPPHSYDLAHCDFFLYPKYKMDTRGQHWDDIETIKRDMTGQMRSLTSKDFKGCFDQWKRRCDDAFTARMERILKGIKLIYNKL